MAVPAKSSIQSRGETPMLLQKKSLPRLRRDFHIVEIDRPRRVGDYALEIQLLRARRDIGGEDAIGPGAVFLDLQARRPFTDRLVVVVAEAEGHAAGELAFLERRGANARGKRHHTPT